eukprot:scaffold184635_cov21-Tisochrysis_lutea.AAC.1
MSFQELSRSAPEVVLGRPCPFNTLVNNRGALDEARQILLSVMSKAVFLSKCVHDFERVQMEGDAPSVADTM